LNEYNADLAEFQKMLQLTIDSERERQQKELYGEFSSEVLLWLGLGPGWSIPLAEACDFPTSGNEAVSDLFARLEARNLVQSFQSGIGNDPFFTLRPTILRQVLNRFDSDIKGIFLIQETLSDIGRAMSEVGPDVHMPSPNANDWAQLAARANDAGAMADFFDEQVNEAYEAKDTARILVWIELARPLAAWLAEGNKTEMDLALERGARQLDLLQRRRLDEQYLVHFLERPEQQDAFDRLLYGEEDQWALHYLGAGGVGKTMFIRHIKSRLADPKRLAVARIDFDYLNPDYPSLAPGLLLWSFAQELSATYLDTHGRSKLADANKKLRLFHQRLRSGRLEYRQERATAHPLFRDALKIYIEVLRRLNRRVLLIVDTCEELAKIRPDGTVPQSVEETFRILRALHDGPDVLIDDLVETRGGNGIPGLRVIFGGRRPLASEGYGWRCPTVPELPVRPYLRLHEMRGFRVDEAERYLRDDLQIPTSLIEPVINRSSPDLGSAAEILWDNPSEGPEPGIERCNPFELRLFADWALDEPPPTAETIASASTADYVEIRILGRLRYQPLEDVVPLVALLGHLDRRALDALCDADEDVRNIIWDRLLQQEWTDYHLAPMGDGEERMVIDVNIELQPRLLAYYQERGSLAAVRRQAADYLEWFTLEEPLNQLDWSDFDAAIRALDTDPTRAYAWWHKVEKRILGRGREWAQELLASLTGAAGAVGLGKEDAPSGPENVLRPAVLAAYGGTLIHAGAPENAAEMYREAASSIARLQAEGETAAGNLDELSWVAQAGLLTASYTSADRVDPELAMAFVRRLPELRADTLSLQGYGAIVAAAEAVLERMAATALVDQGAGEQLLDQIGGEVTMDEEWAEALLDPDGSGTGDPLIDDEIAIDQQWTETVLDPDGSGTGGPLVHLSQILVKFAAGVGPEQKKLALALGAYSAGLAGLAMANLGESEKLSDRFQQAIDELELSGWDWRKSVQKVTNLAFNAQPNLLNSALIAMKWFDQSLSVETPGGWAEAWIHWKPPENLGARIRLELVLALQPGGLTLANALAILEPGVSGLEWTPDLDGDHDRLLSLALQAQLALEPREDLLPRSEAIVEAAQAAGQIAAPPKLTAHRQVAPMAVTAALHLVQAGRIIPALELLDTVGSDTYDFWTAWHASRAEAQISRRMRLYVGGTTLLNESANPEDRALVWAQEALAGVQTEEVPALPDGLETVEEAAWLHAMWRTRNLLQPSAAIHAIDWAADRMFPYVHPPSPAQLEMVHLYLDLLEASLYMGVNLFANDKPLVEEDVTVYIIAFNPATHPRPDSILRLWLRASVLQQVDKEEEEKALDVLSERLGRWQRAEIAREEGEMLALRVRAAGVELLARALEWSVEGGDALQTLITATTYSIARSADKELSVQQRPDSNVDSIGLKAYQSLQETQEWLPPWESLPEIAGEKDPFKSCPASWMPWFLRLLIWRKQAADEKTSGSYVPPTYQSYQSGGTLLAPGELADIGKDSKPIDGSVPWWRDTDLIVGASALGLLSIGVLVGLFYLIRWLGGLVSGAAGEGDLDLLLEIGLFCIGPIVLVAVLYFSFKWVLRALRSMWEVIVFGILFIGLVVGLFYLFRWLGGLLFGPVAEELGLLLQIGIFCGGPIALVLLLYFSIRAAWGLRAHYLVKGRLELIVKEKSLTTSIGLETTTIALQDKPFALRLHYQPANRFWFLFPIRSLFRRLSPDVTGSMNFPGAVPYKTLAEGVPAECSEQLDKLIAAARGRALSLVVRAQIPDHHGPAWEAALWPAESDEEAQSRWDSIRSRRAVQPLQAAVKPIYRSDWEPGQSSMVIITGNDSRIERTQQRAWAAAGEGVTVRRKGESSFYDANKVPGFLSEKLEMLHLVGNVREDPDLRFYPATREDPGLELKGSTLMGLPDSDGSSGGLNASILAGGIPNLTLCLLQGSPRILMGETREESERDEALRMRTFCAELAAAGVPAVILFPSLEPELSVDVVQPVVELVGRAKDEQPDLDALQVAVIEAQQRIYAYYKEKDEDAAWERAMDVSLFSAEDWKFGFVLDSRSLEQQPRGGKTDSAGRT
jgi:hypothetical protein